MKFIKPEGRLTRLGDDYVIIRLKLIELGALSKDLRPFPLLGDGW